LLSGLASEEPRWRLWPYFVPLPVFVIQLAWPTVIGWRATVAGWFLCCFVPFLYERVCRGGAAFDNWFLVLFGLAPLLPLYIFRPRMTDAGPASTRREK
jgi:hypothetical protein